MFKSVFVCFGLSLLGTFAMAGSANLDIGQWGLSYNVSTMPNMVMGFETGFGISNGKINLNKANGAWSGTFGMTRVSASSPKVNGDKTEITVTSFPGDTSVFTIDTSKSFKVTALMRSVQYFSDLKDAGKSLEVSTEYGTVALTRKTDTEYDGQAISGIDTALATLKVSGDLTPTVLASQDPGLFILLYILPYSLPNQ